MPETSRHLPDEAAMLALGAEIAAEACPGDVVALNGPLGAGKTHFAKGFVAGLGSPDVVTSPTFTLVHHYRGGRLPVYHFDFYRLETVDELTGIGWDDYLDAADGVLLVEWAGKHREALPPGAAWWYFRLGNESGRVASGPFPEPLQDPALDGERGEGSAR